MLVAKMNHKYSTSPWSGQDGFGSKFLGVYLSLDPLDQSIVPGDFVLVGLVSF